VVADSVVLSLIDNGMLESADFLTWHDACYLTDDGRKTFFEAYEQRKATEVTHPVFGYKMSYGRMLRSRPGCCPATCWVTSRVMSASRSDRVGLGWRKDGVDRIGGPVSRRDFLLRASEHRRERPTSAFPPLSEGGPGGVNEGGARGGERCLSQCDWTPVSVGFCKGRAVQLDRRGGCLFPAWPPPFARRGAAARAVHPPWPPLRKGGTDGAFVAGKRPQQKPAEPGLQRAK